MTSMKESSEKKPMMRVTLYSDDPILINRVYRAVKKTIKMNKKNTALRIEVERREGDNPKPYPWAVSGDTHDRS